MEDLVLKLKALSDMTRLKAFKLVQGASADLCVCDLASALGVAQPTVTVHLQKLKRAGLVRSRRVGQWTYYSADPEGLASFRGDLDGFLAASPSGLPALAGLLARLKGLCCEDGTCPAPRSGRESRRLDFKDAGAPAARKGSRG